MRERRTDRRRSRLGASLCCAALFAGAGGARADDLLGYYFGGSYGKATVDASTGLVSGFGVHSSAYSVIAGWRPISELAAELWKRSEEWTAPSA